MPPPARCITPAQYEPKVVCEVPENFFGAKFEYIRFQMLDPDDDRVSIQVCAYG